MAPRSKAKAKPKAKAKAKTKAKAKPQVKAKAKPQVKAKTKAKRDIEKTYTNKQFVAKLRRLADSLEQGKRFQIQIAGERIAVPVDALFNVEHEREKGNEEIEFQIKWSNK